MIMQKANLQEMKKNSNSKDLLEVIKIIKNKAMYSIDQRNYDNYYSKCSMCEFGGKSPYSCQDCVGDHSDWTPSKRLKQFLIKRGLKLEKIDDNRQTTIILAFPGCGKTYLKEKLKGSGIKILDSDSSNFDKEEFPRNYINYIESQIGKQDIILISTHEDVRHAVYENDNIMSNCAVYICYPELKIKDLLIQRLRDRGNNEKFCKLIEDNYQKWIADIKIENNFFPIVLGHEKDYLAGHIYELNLPEDKRKIIHDYLYKN